MFYSTLGLSVTQPFRYFLFWLLVCHSLSVISNEMPQYCNKGTQDCTFQLGFPSLPKNSCIIHPTNTCLSMRIPTTGTPPLKQLTSEDDASFQVALVPYLFHDGTDYLYAVNLTMKSRESDITGFSFLLQQEDNGNYTSCRAFDFSKAKDILPDQKISLYYECYTGFQAAANGDYFYNVTVRASPNNHQLKYRTYIPNSGQVVFVDICDWAPLVMLNTAAISQRKVDLKFSDIGSKHEIESYSVKLISEVQPVVKRVPFSPTEEETMHRVVFPDVPGGTYKLAVVPNLKGVKCREQIILTLVLPPESPSFPWYYILIFILLVVVVLVAAHLYFKRFRGKVLSRPKAVILYSEDCPLHMDIVLKFHEFLKHCCSLDVNLDKWDLGNQIPEDWISTMVQDVDFIILVVSKGVKHKADNNNKPEMIEESPWGDLFLTAYRWLFREVSNSLRDHRLVKVIFSSYCQDTHVPKKLRRVGETFNLLKDMNRFLCHLHRKSMTCGLKNFCLVMPGSQYRSHQKGIELQEAIDAMNAYENGNPNWFEGQLKDVTNSCSTPSSPTSSGESFLMSNVKDETEESLILLSK